MAALPAGMFCWLTKAGSILVSSGGGGCGNGAVGNSGVSGIGVGLDAAAITGGTITGGVEGVEGVVSSSGLVAITEGILCYEEVLTPVPFEMMCLIGQTVF